MPEPTPFGLVLPSAYGPVLVNRYDTSQTPALLQTGRALNHKEIVALCGFLQHAPAGAVALDVGACFGLYALAFARALAARQGRVHAFEAQRLLAYLIGGTVALNGVENLCVHHQAVGSAPGRLPIPQFDYHALASFGSVEFGATQQEFIGQARGSDPQKAEEVEVVRLDDLGLTNVHLVKVDVEGMEAAVLAGAQQLIERDRPVLCLEWIKSDKAQLVSWCRDRGYRVFNWGLDLLAVHRDKQGDYPVSIALTEL